MNALSQLQLQLEALGECKPGHKADIPAEIHKYLFYELCDQYADYCRIYIDGSKAGERVTSAIVYKGITKSVRLPDLTSIFREKIRNFLRFAI